jgi:hypothetical protein
MKNTRFNIKYKTEVRKNRFLHPPFIEFSPANVLAYRNSLFIIMKSYGIIIAMKKK